MAAVSADRGADWRAGHVRRLTAALASFPVPVTLHVFADAGTHAQLADLTDAGEVRVVRHDPAGARTSRVERTRRRRWPSPARTWADWVVDGLDGRAADVLHVACPGHLDVDVPLLTMAPDPAAPGGPGARAFATVDQVQQLADSVGAPALTLGSPPGNPSDVATRLLADTAGDQRPGPTVYAGLADGAEPALVGVWALLAQPTAGTPLPTDPRLFAYLQPADIAPLLAAPLPDHVRTLGPAAGHRSPPGAVADLTAGDHPLVPAPEGPADQWVAAGARFVDTVVAELAATTGDRPGQHSTAYARGASRAVRDLTALLARYGGTA